MRPDAGLVTTRAIAIEAPPDIIWHLTEGK
jgi:hypothetical protein